MRDSIVEHTLAVEHGERIGNHQNGVRRLAVHDREGLVEVVGLAYTDRLDLDADLPRRFCGSLIAQRHAEIVLVPQHRNTVKVRQQLLQ